MFGGLGMVGENPCDCHRDGVVKGEGKMVTGQEEADFRKKSTVVAQILDVKSKTLNTAIKA